MMAMGDYLAEIEYAAQNLFPIIWQERDHLQFLKEQVALLTRVTERNYQRAEHAAMNADDPDDVAMAAGMYWDNYFWR
jgi:hypothetical protein